MPISFESSHDPMLVSVTTHFTPKEVSTSINEQIIQDGTVSFFFKSTIYYTGLVGRPRWNSIIDVTWRTVNKEQIYQWAHWSLNTVSGIFVVNPSLQAPASWYLVDLPVINGNSLMAVACIYLHRRHVHTRLVTCSTFLWSCTAHVP